MFGEIDEKIEEQENKEEKPKEEQLFVEEDSLDLPLESVIEEEPSISDAIEDLPLSQEVIEKGKASEEVGASEKPEQPEVAPVEQKEEETKGKKKQVLLPLDPQRAALPWYAVHTYSGFEQRVRLSLDERIRTQNLSHKFGNIIVPQETVEELVRGKKKTSTRKIYPGYVMVQMQLDDETWHLVKGTPKVTGFVGDSHNPLPLSEQEVKDLLGHIEGGTSKPKPRVHFEQGDQVKVIDGPFTDFNATVDEVRQDKGKLRVLISIFGRSTPVELDFVQVEKL